MSFETLEINLENQIAQVILNRPEKANAAAEKSGGKAYLDFDEMLESEKIDVLDI